jgi:hypothetical protein
MLGMGWEVRKGWEEMSNLYSRWDATLLITEEELPNILII